MVLNFQKTKYNPAEIQYHTSVASLVVQIPTLYLFSSGSGWEDLLNPHLGLCYLLNGIFFHFQTMYAYALMDAISPVSHR
jgi:solute carrier family 35 protein E2